MSDIKLISYNLKTENFEKVAFMGQIPISVRGIVNEGDFIIITQEEKERYLKDAVVFLSVAGISQEELDKINTEEER